MKKDINVLYIKIGNSIKMRIDFNRLDGRNFKNYDLKLLWCLDIELILIR